MGLEKEEKCAFKKKKERERNTPPYQLHLNLESIGHLPNKALSPLSYRGAFCVIRAFSKRG